MDKVIYINLGLYTWEYQIYSYGKDTKLELLVRLFPYIFTPFPWLVTDVWYVSLLGIHKRNTSAIRREIHSSYNYH